MTTLTEICILLIGVNLLCDITNSSPLFEGINIERKINIGFKPLKFKPLTFIHEKWGPFGRFGKKHTIERRDLDDMNTIDKGDEIELVGAAAGRTIPVVEKIEEPPILIPIPSYRPPVQAVIASSVPPPVKLLNTEISPAIPSNPYFTPVGRNVNLNSETPLGPIPVIELNPVEVPLIVPPQDNEEQSVPPSSQPPKKNVEPSPPPPRPGIISFFSELFSELMTRFIARARATFGQLGTPPVQQ